MTEAYDVFNGVLTQIEEQFATVDFSEAVKNSDNVKLTRNIIQCMRAADVPDYVFDSINIEFPNDSGLTDEQLVDFGERMAAIFIQAYQAFVDEGLEVPIIKNLCKGFSITLDV